MEDLPIFDAMGDFLDPSIFQGYFPQLPDFPCMSSSSSSSSSPETFSLVSSSSSMEQKNHLDHLLVEAPLPALSSNASMDILDQLDLCILDDIGYLDTPKNNDLFDPSSMLNNSEDFQQQEQNPAENNSEELGTMFFEWLKMNKDSICEEDLRRIKIKKSTIECAAHRLGGGKEAMKKLLKLILEWIKSTQLRKRKIRETNIHHHPHYNQKPNPNSIPSVEIPRTPCATNPTFVMAASSGYPMIYYAGHPFSNIISQPNAPPTYSQLWTSSNLTVPSGFNLLPSKNFQPPPPSLLQLPLYTPGFSGYRNEYQNKYFHADGDRLMTLVPSSTKQARKNRMARQKRILAHHQRNQNNHIHDHQNQQHNRIQSVEQQVDTGTWVYFPPPSSTSAVIPLVPIAKPPMPTPSCRPQIKPVPQQVWEDENNLRFLLRKVLKHSDVNNLGRIVLPKKDAEMHLPELEARDGIQIAMEDIVTSQVWNLRYRFWPNNKSRMYLLENTGDFVKSNGLEEGDSVVIYSDIKSDKYLIRGVKVQEAEENLETKRSDEQQKRKKQEIASSTDNSSALVTIETSKTNPTSTTFL